MEIRTTPSSELYLDLLKKCLTGILYDESGWKYVPELNFAGKKIQLLPNVALVRKVPLDRAAREEGKDTPYLGYTMVGIKRLDNVRFCIEEVLRRDIPGDIMEAGVWRGGCAIYMQALLKVHGVTDRTLWLADSFQGMPPPGPVDLAALPGVDMSVNQGLKVSLEQVRENFKRFDLLDAQVSFIEGWFHQTLAKAPVNQLAVLRLDADLYQSTVDILNALYDKVSPGGFVIIDDYYSWKSCRTAVTEFRERRNIRHTIHQIDWTGGYWRVEP